MVRALIYLSALMVALTGCSTLGVGESEFACGEGSDGTRECDSVAEVYRATNGRDYRNASKRTKLQSDQVIAPPSRVAPMSPPNWPAPVLEPASVLRIWVAPWVDDSKALHWPSYIFAEVTPRKWSFGNTDFRETRPLVPIQIDRRQTDETQENQNPNRKGEQSE